MSQTGKYNINGRDAYSTYGLTFERGTFAQLLKPAKRRFQYVEVWLDTSGTDRDLSKPAFETRELKLPVVLLANSEADWWAKYNAFTQFLISSGYFYFDAMDLQRRFILLYSDCSDMSLLTTIKGGKVVARFSLTVLDDYPGAVYTINQAPSLLVNSKKLRVNSNYLMVNKAS